MRQYYVYTMASRTGVLYTGFTSDLARRVYANKHGLLNGFTRKYKVKALVYYQTTSDIQAAISREKQIKAWRRSKKIDLIESMNHDWRDLGEAPFSISPPDFSLRSE